MNYHHSRTIQDARRQGKMVIMGAGERVYCTRTLRVTKTKRQRDILSTDRTRYRIDCEVAYSDLCDMVNGWNYEHDKPQIEFKKEDWVTIEHFYVMARLCDKLRKFPKARS
jgi:hypothetical protein